MSKRYRDLHMAISVIRVKRISKDRELSPKQWCNMMQTQIEPVAQMMADMAEAQRMVNRKNAEEAA